MAETNIVNGMNLDKLEAFRSAIADAPVVLGLDARSVWEGHSGRSTVHIGPYDLGGQHIDRDTRRYTIPYGAWREVEETIGFVGPTDRVEPVEMALGAVAACLTNSIALNAPRHGINSEGMEVDDHTDVDPSVLFEVKGPDDHTSCMPKISTEVKVKGDFTDEHLESSHVPLVRGIPRLERLVTNRIAGSLTGESPFYLLIELHFQSEEAMQEGLNSEAGQAMGADFSRFASGGVTVVFERAESEAGEA